MRLFYECNKSNAYYRQAFIEYEQKDEIELKIQTRRGQLGKMEQIESKPLTIVRNEVMKRIPKWDFSVHMNYITFIYNNKETAFSILPSFQLH